MTLRRKGREAFLGCFFLLVSVLGPPTSASGWETDATAFVTRVVDGDTFHADSLGRVRLADIDAPEVGEPGAREATAHLVALVYRQRIYLDLDDLHGTDRYGRLVVVAYVRHNATHLLNVNAALLQAGHAKVRDFPNEFDPIRWSLFVYYPAEEMPVAPRLARDRAVAAGVLVVSSAAACLAFALFGRRKPS